ncbi:hypothetical protein SVXHr_1609 [Halorhabdus sp. SVX81]|uniref:MetS family NSS transporter small subunit n=1 Tax=Halorhabdus sp. SVX81 TaxID=2978283 RepID=UPI0023DA57AF|nr:MetS family NSS transporter small subunit [Halorhabdus sp. SVX81]WEL17776.1 hypothetical protein SVXHr_1609 [Halorhabdus sp. SVX81]
MTAIDPGALAMAIFGFVFLFGGLAVTLWIALQSGGYGDDESMDGDKATADDE